jgi:hypothetical protein
MRTQSSQIGLQTQQFPVLLSIPVIVLVPQPELRGHLKRPKINDLRRSRGVCVPKRVPTASDRIGRPIPTVQAGAQKAVSILGCEKGALSNSDMSGRAVLNRPDAAVSVYSLPETIPWTHTST